MLTIRPALPEDVPIMLRMLTASGVDQGFPQSIVVTEEDLVEDGFGLHPRFICEIAEVDQTPAGLVLYFFNYSTWISRKGLYVEDIYVAPEFRRRGVGRALLDHLMEVARKEGCGRMQWMVYRGNESAIRLYESFGARLVDDWVLMTVTGKDL
jgi:GNAT superfamily N-acetyltransferase